MTKKKTQTTVAPSHNHAVIEELLDRVSELEGRLEEVDQECDNLSDSLIATDASLDELWDEWDKIDRKMGDTTSLVDDAIGKAAFRDDVWSDTDTLDTDGLMLESRLNVIAESIHNIAKDAGWWDDAWLDKDDVDNIQVVASKLLMLHTEITEATEELRETEDIQSLAIVDIERENENGKPCGFAVELADLMIRTLDLCAYLNIDIESVMAEKIAYNKTRSYRHGGKNL